MANEFKLLGKVTIAGKADSDGDILLEARSSTIYMTRKEVRQMRDHLNMLLDALVRPDFAEGDMVRILRTSHKDLIGKIGQVSHVLTSGNLEVWTDSSVVVLDPMWVEGV